MQRNDVTRRLPPLTPSPSSHAHNHPIADASTDSTQRSTALAQAPNETTDSTWRLRALPLIPSHQRVSLLSADEPTDATPHTLLNFVHHTHIHILQERVSCTTTNRDGVYLRLQ
jgi:hypothetical protein